MNSGEGVDGEKLVEWYLEQKEDELNTEEEYHAEKALTQKIIKRMVKVCSRNRTNCLVGKYPYGYQRPRLSRRGRRR